MYISSHSIVSNSDMIKNYKKCREKAEGLGKVFILKFNEPDAVLFSMKEYEKLSDSLDKMQSKIEKDSIKAAEKDSVKTKEDDIVIIYEDSHS